MEENKCKKCNGKLALVHGYYEHEPDNEPFQSGIEEDSGLEVANTYLCAYKCTSCNHLQGFWEE